MSPVQSAPRSSPRAGVDAPGLAACLVVLCFVACVAWFKIESLDTGYHLAYGGRFLDHHSIVDRDPFLYPENAEPFVNANWASQIIMALAERAAGYGGLIALRLVLLCTIFACIAHVVRARSKGLHWIASSWLLAAAAGYERFSLRPELFSYAIMSLMLVVLMRGLRSRAAVAALVFLQLAWVNLHSYFLIGLLMTGAWLAGACIDWLRRRDFESRARVRQIGMALLLQVIVCFGNPWTWRGAVFPLQTLSYLSRESVIGAGSDQPASNAWSLISEFHSPLRYFGEQISGRTLDAYVTLLFVALIGLIASFYQARFAHAGFLLLLAVMSFQMRRNIAQFALAGAPLAITAIAAAMDNSTRRRLVRTTRLVLLVGATLLSAWWASGIVSGRFYYHERRITRQFGAGLSDRTFAGPAVRWLADHKDLQPNLFVDYFSSSNTLLWLPERFKLFVDTNTFAYKEQTLAAAFDVGLGRIDHNTLFDRRKINIALLHCGPDTQPLVKRLVADYTNWALVYFDRQAVIFVRRMSEHVPLIRANQPTANDLDARTWIASFREPAYTKALSLNTAANVPICLGWYAPAAQLLEEAVKLARDYHEAWYSLGTCYANLGNAAAREKRYDEAGRWYGRARDAAYWAATVGPNYPPARALEHDMRQVLQALLN